MTRASIGLLLTLATLAPAQEGKEQPAASHAAAPAVPPESLHRPVEWSVKVGTELGFNSNLDNAPGDVTVSRISAELGVAIPIATMAQLDLGFDYDYSRYDFTGATAFIAGSSSPWQDVYRETITARFTQQHDRRLAWLVGGSLRFSAEEGGDVGNSVSGSAYGGALYHVSESLMLGGVLGVSTRLEKDPWLVLFPIVDWKIDPQWRLSNAGKPGLHIFYSPSQRWTLSLGSWYDFRDFRLDDSGPVPGGVGRDESVPVQFGATFRPTGNMTIDLATGVRLWQSYEVLNSAGNTVSEIDADPAPFLSFSVGVKF